MATSTQQTISDISQMCIPLAGDDLGDIVPQHIKEKIWNHEYVDLATMLSTTKGSSYSEVFRTQCTRRFCKYVHICTLCSKPHPPKVCRA
ncbi:uncharacterized protein [Haliotis cracherodii]|uniref:uncharacterized protein n=1 Tax=Haliotis cracherodii TaxID=6455 RepID=UPI0039EC647E